MKPPLKHLLQVKVEDGMEINIKFKQDVMEKASHILNNIVAVVLIPHV